MPSKDTLATIRRIAVYVRKWAEKNVHKFNTYDDLSGMCAVCSSMISKLLERRGIAHRICESEGWSGNHVFITVDRMIIDVTASQFNYEFPDVIVMPRKQWREMVKLTGDEDWWKTRRVHRSRQALREHQEANGWPEEQTAIP